MTPKTDVDAGEIMDAIARYLCANRYHLENALQELIARYEKEHGRTA